MIIAIKIKESTKKKEKILRNLKKNSKTLVNYLFLNFIQDIQHLQTFKTGGLAKIKYQTLKFLNL